MVRKSLTSNSLTDKLQRFWRDEEAASAAEYGLIIALVGMGLLVALGFFRTSLGNLLTNAGNTIQGAGGP